MLRGKVRTAVKEVSKLHGVDAQFVSLVGAGANETPFTIVKHKKDGDKGMTRIKKRRAAGKASSKKSHKNINPARKKKTDSDDVQVETLVAKMVFDGSLYETEADVEEYLEAAEWESSETSIVKNEDDDWEVRPDGTTDEDFLKLGKVETNDDGVSAFVGTREVEAKTEEDEEDEEDEDEADTLEKDEEDDEDEEDEPAAVAKTAPKAKASKRVKLSKRAEFLAKRKSDRASEQKFDAWDAKYSDENTIAKALSAGMEWDGVPPGYYEVQATFAGVAATIVGDGELDAAAKQTSLNKAALDFAEIIGGLDTFFDQYTASAEAVTASIDEKGHEALVKWADGYADFVGGEEAPAPAKKASVAKSTKVDTINPIASIADLVAKAVEPLVKQVEGVTDTVQALAARRPTKKAAPSDDSGDATSGKVTKADKKADQAAVDFANSFLG